MAESRAFSRPSRNQLALALLALLLLAVLAAFVIHAIGFAHLKSLAHTAIAWCATVNPLLFVLAFTFLPYVGVPSSLLYLLAASAYGPVPALGWSCLALACNVTFGYVIGSWLRRPISGWLERKGRKLPEVPPSETWRLVLLTRILPGPPLVMQNLLLAVAGVPFLLYLAISLPVQFLLSAGLILTGGALFHGQKGLLIFGVCLIVALALLAHVVKTMYEARRRAAAAPPPDAPRPPA